MTDLVTNPEPVFTVDQQVVGALTRDAVALAVAEDTHGLRTLELRLLAQGPKDGADADGILYLDGRDLDFGSALEVKLGAGDEARTVFSGTVSAIEAAFEVGEEPFVRVLAEDALMKLRLTRRCKTWKQVSDADIARQLAGLHQLDAQVDADGPTYDVVQQWNQSDLAFLRDRARLVQAELWVRQGALHFVSRPSRHGNTLTLTQGVELLSLAVRGDLSHQRAQVAVSGYDAQKREAIDEKGGADAVQSEASRGRTGPSVLADALGEGLASLRVREVPLVKGEATAWARAEMLRRARRFVTAEGTTRGIAALDVGDQLTLNGIGAPFSGDGYYVTGVRHAWSRDDGFRTHFEAERLTLNQP